MPWESKSKVEQRLEFVIRAESGEKVSKLSKEYGISRVTGYEWLRRYQKSGTIISLHDRSHRPIVSPQKIDNSIESQICKLRKKYGWGGKKLQVLLAEKGINVSVPTVNRVIKRNSLLVNEACHRPALKRFERSEPNQLWQSDFKGPMGRGDAKCEPLTFIDDHSRFVLGAIAVRTKQTEETCKAFIKIFEKYGVPEALLLDHGVPWWSVSHFLGFSKFSVWLMKQDLRIIFSGIRHPQTQGKIERFHKTLDHAVRHKGTPTDFSQWTSILPEVVKEYNFVRPHEALKMQTPAKHYRPSKKAYNPRPKSFEYSEQMKVFKIDSHGMFSLKGKRLFVSQALVGEYVGTNQLSQSLVVSYRNSIVREINLSSGESWEPANHLSTCG